MPDFHTSYSSMPTHNICNKTLTVVLQFQTIGYFLDSEAGFEEEERDGLHELKSVDLVSEKSLFSPHCAHEQVLVFEEQRKHAHQNVDCPFAQLPLLFLVNRLVLC